ncbi:MAG: DUF1877 family protein [Pirellulaceae bacterium]
MTGVLVKGIGAHIILTRDNAKRVFAAAGDESVRQVVSELRQSRKLRDAKLVLETGPSWAPIHRCLSDGSLDPTGGDFPLNHVILGGKRLHLSNGFEAIIVRPDIVPHVAEALHDLKRNDIHDKYAGMSAEDLGHPPSEREFDIVWNSLQQIRQLFEDAANERCAVLFTVEQ